MKEYNIKHETMIIGKSIPVNAKEAKEGDLIKHKNKVTCVKTFYGNTKDNMQNGSFNVEYIPVVLSREFILDLAEQIKEIESKETAKPFDPELPF